MKLSLDEVAVLIEEVDTDGDGEVGSAVVVCFCAASAIIPMPGDLTALCMSRQAGNKLCR